MTMGTSGSVDRLEVKKIVVRLDVLQERLKKLDPTAPCEEWILVRLNACIARLEAVKFINQPMERI